MDADTYRLAGLLLSVVTLVVVPLMWRLGRLGVNFDKRLDHLDQCVDEVKAHQSEKDVLVNRLENELSYLKGVMGVPLDQPVTVPKEEL